MDFIHYLFLIYSILFNFFLNKYYSIRKLYFPIVYPKFSTGYEKEIKSKNLQKKLVNLSNFFLKKLRFLEKNHFLLN